MGNTLVSFTRVRVAVFQNGGNGLFRYNDTLSLSNVAVAFDVDNDVVIVFVPPVFEVVSVFDGSNPSRGPEMVTEGYVLAQGYMVAKGSYRVRFIDDSLEENANTSNTQGNAILYISPIYLRNDVQT
jgi:hypothetical protein